MPRPVSARLAPSLRRPSETSRGADATRAARLQTAGNLAQAAETAARFRQGEETLRHERDTAAQKLEAIEREQERNRRAAAFETKLSESQAGIERDIAELRNKIPLDDPEYAAKANAVVQESLGPLVEEFAAGQSEAFRRTIGDRVRQFAAGVAVNNVREQARRLVKSEAAKAEAITRNSVAALLAGGVTIPESTDMTVRAALAQGFSQEAADAIAMQAANRFVEQAARRQVSERDADPLRNLLASGHLTEEQKTLVTETIARIDRRNATAAADLLPELSRLVNAGLHVSDDLIAAVENQIASAPPAERGYLQSILWQAKIIREYDGRPLLEIQSAMNEALSAAHSAEAGSDEKNKRISEARALHALFKRRGGGDFKAWGDALNHPDPHQAANSLESLIKEQDPRLLNVAFYNMSNGGFFRLVAGMKSREDRDAAMGGFRMLNGDHSAILTDQKNVPEFFEQIDIIITDLLGPGPANDVAFDRGALNRVVKAHYLRSGSLEERNDHRKDEAELRNAVRRSFNAVLGQEEFMGEAHGGVQILNGVNTIIPAGYTPTSFNYHIEHRVAELMNTGEIVDAAGQPVTSDDLFDDDGKYRLALVEIPGRGPTYAFSPRGRPPTEVLFYRGGDGKSYPLYIEVPMHGFSPLEEAQEYQRERNAALEERNAALEAIPFER